MKPFVKEEQNKGPCHIQQKLDICFINPPPLLNHHPILVEYHHNPFFNSAIMIIKGKNVGKTSIYPFIFKSMWLRHPKFFNFIYTNRGRQIIACIMVNFALKLRNLKNQLK